MSVSVQGSCLRADSMAITGLPDSVCVTWFNLGALLLLPSLTWEGRSKELIGQELQVL